MRVLISAFGCVPGMGSERGNGWNWSAALADAGHEVTVLTVAGHRRQVAAGLAARSDGRLRVVHVATPRSARRVKGQLGVYAKYLAWQWAAYRVARRLVRTGGFDLVHHISWGSLQLGTWMGRLPLPLVFGPVGGGQTAQRSLRSFYAGDWRTEAIRTFVTRQLMRFDPFARMTARRARLVLVNNAETGEVARRLGASDVRYASELGLAADEVIGELPPPIEGRPLRLLWVGRLMPRKGLPLALRAVAAAATQVPVRLTILGGGPQADDVVPWAEELGIADIVDHRGTVPFDEVQAEYRRSDLMLFSSLRDSSGAQLLEAMAAGLPIVALDQSGAAALIGRDRGLLVEPGDADATVSRMAAAIVGFARDPELRIHLSEGALRYARTQRWPDKVAEMTAVYATIVSDRASAPSRSDRVSGDRA